MTISSSDSESDHAAGQTATARTEHETNEPLNIDLEVYMRSSCRVISCGWEELSTKESKLKPCLRKITRKSILGWVIPNFLEKCHLHVRVTLAVTLWPVLKGKLSRAVNLKKSAWTFQVWFKTAMMQGKTARIWRAFGGERDNSRQKSRFREQKVTRKRGMSPQTNLFKSMRSSWQFPLSSGEYIEMLYSEM